MLFVYLYFENYVDVCNYVVKVWLYWFGFILEDLVLYGVFGLLFYCFYMEKN